jgi:hypothetical protein
VGGVVGSHVGVWLWLVLRCCAYMPCVPDAPFSPLPPWPLLRGRRRVLASLPNRTMLCVHELWACAFMVCFRVVLCVHAASPLLCMGGGGVVSRSLCRDVPLALPSLSLSSLYSCSLRDRGCAYVSLLCVHALLCVHTVLLRPRVEGCGTVLRVLFAPASLSTLALCVVLCVHALRTIYALCIGVRRCFWVLLCMHGGGLVSRSLHCGAPLVLPSLSTSALYPSSLRDWGCACVSLLCVHALLCVHTVLLRPRVGRGWPRCGRRVHPP